MTVQIIYTRSELSPHAAAVLLQPFYSSVHFIWNYPGELVPEK